MEDRNLNNKPTDGSKGKNFWKAFGIFALALVIAVITVLVVGLK